MGVGIATVTDLQLNVLGSVLSLLAVITTCIAQIVSSAILLQFFHSPIFLFQILLCIWLTEVSGV